ncbi:MAG: nucleotidyltransferase [Bacteroidetes bacterium]|nr:MAG: nucleotidyltransferase [Bacteroidota bacterium]
MKIIIPMAGMGKRMRPHTLTIPKPLINIAGKPIVQRLAEGIVKVAGKKVDEIAFIIGDFGSEVEQKLIGIAENLGAKGSIYYQHEALGTAHAIHCAAESLKGNVIVAFADTLFDADFQLDAEKDGIIWTHKVDDPSAFGVVKKNDRGIITDFIEKPKEFVSDEAIIGIYYFKDGENLRSELQYLMDNNIVKGGEYQLTDALENMKLKGLMFYSGQVKEWLDCGNKDATVYTNTRSLELIKDEVLISRSAQLINTQIIEPCFIGDDVVLENSIIGPHVSVETKTIIKNSVITNSMIGSNSIIEGGYIDNSMIGNSVIYKKAAADLSLGDFSTLK